MKQRFTLIFVLSCLLVGCSVKVSAVALSTTIISTPVVTRTATSLPSNPSIEGTATKTQTPTFTITPMPTFTSTPSALTQMCLDIPEIEETSLDMISDLGRVVMVDNINDYHSYYILDLATRARIELPLSDSNAPLLTDFNVSPNGSTLVYSEGRPGKAVWVVNTDGIVLGEYPPFELGLVGARWLNDERMEVDWNGSSYPPDVKQGGVVIFNPFTGDKQYLAPSFPDIYDTLPPAFWTAQYSPNLEWVAYVKWWSTGYTGVGIWDVEEQKMIWEKHDSGSTFRNPPVWKSSGEWVMILADGVIYRINRAGEVRLLPDPRNSGWGYIETFSGSPDGRYLAFWVDVIQERDGVGLFILDTETNRVLDYCVYQDSFSGRIEWSFDSQQIIVWGGKQDALGQLHDQVIFIDQIQKRVHLLSPDQMPLAWLKSEP